MPVTQPLAYLHSPVFVAFLFLWECRLLLCCCIVQLISWLVICVFRVACDFVSRLGGWDTYFFIERLVETFLGGPHFSGSGAQVSTRIPFPFVVVSVSRLCDTRRWVQAQCGPVHFGSSIRPVSTFASEGVGSPWLLQLRHVVDLHRACRTWGEPMGSGSGALPKVSKVAASVAVPAVKMSVQR